MELLPLPAALIAFAQTEIARQSVPGAAIGVLHGGNMYAAGVGTTSVEHPLPVTPQTLFQIGSTSKTFTATAVMQLVQEGALDLDATVRTYLPWFRLQSEADAACLMVRQLVTHHAGYVGDYFLDTGRGDDAIGAIVRKMANSPQLVPAGYTFSYSNAAFFVLGHIVETLRGKPFERVIAERILAPLGMDRSFYFPEDCITHRVAVGHIVTANGPVVVRRWHTPRSIAPGGGITSNVIDQLRYAALHTDVTPDARVLAQTAIEYMRQPQRAAGSMCDSIGIAWMLEAAGGGHALVKHGGATNGQLSSFEMVPSAGFAVTVLTNADTGRETRQTIADRCQQYFLGFDKPQPLAAPGLHVNLSEFAGEYHAVLARLRVDVAGDGLLIEDIPPPRAGDPRLQPVPLPPAQLLFTARDAAAVLAGPRKGERVEFLRDADGRIAWLRWDGRIAHRLGQA